MANKKLERSARNKAKKKLKLAKPEEKTVKKEEKPKS